MAATDVGLPVHRVESEEDLLARIMTAADFGLAGIGDRVYQKKLLCMC